MLSHPFISEREYAVIRATRFFSSVFANLDLRIRCLREDEVGQVTRQLTAPGAIGRGISITLVAGDASGKWWAQ